MRRMMILVLVSLAAQVHAEPAAVPTAAGGIMMFVPWIAILGIFYFLLIRPQQKQAQTHRTMLDNLKRGDRILTQGGLYGSILAVKGQVLEIKIGEDTKVQLAKSHVAQLVTTDPALETEVVSNGSKS